MPVLPEVLYERSLYGILVLGRGARNFGEAAFDVQVLRDRFTASRTLKRDVGDRQKREFAMVQFNIGESVAPRKPMTTNGGKYE